MTETEARWRALVAEWRESGRTAAEFVSDKGVSESSLRWWSWQLEKRARAATTPPKRRSRRRAAPSTPKLVRVVRAEASVVANSEPITILAGEVRIAVPVGFDEEHLRRVLRVLAEAT